MLLEAHTHTALSGTPRTASEFQGILSTKRERTFVCFGSAGNVCLSTFFALPSLPYCPEGRRKIGVSGPSEEAEIARTHLRLPQKLVSKPHKGTLDNAAVGTSILSVVILVMFCHA